MNDENDPTQPLPTPPATTPPVTTPLPAPEGGVPGDGTATARIASPTASTPSGSVPPPPRDDAGSFVRRHAVGVALTAAALAVVLLAGGTAWGVSAAVAAGQAPMSATSTAHEHTAAKAAAAKKGAEHARKHHGVRGTLTAMDGSTWTIHAASGATVTVTVSTKTAFGTAAKPEQSSSFAVGDRIGVLGTRSGDTIAATRVVLAPMMHRTATPTPAPTA